MKKIIPFLFFILPLFAWSQAITPEEALEKLSKYPQERIWMKFDKSDYLAGETMRFKAYVFSQSALSRISTNLYVECMDSKKRVVYKNLYPVATGIADGSFVIPKDFPEDVYYIRAYTNWMLNFNDRTHFVQPVNVYNPSSLTTLIERPIGWEASAHPEGGTLVDNMETDVAVRLHPAGRLPGKWNGYLFDNADTGTKITEFTSLNEEIAITWFAPVYGKQYSIKITDDHNHSKIISLPAVDRQGISLKTKNGPRGVAYRITAKGLDEQLKGYKLVAHTRGELIYSVFIKTNKEEVNGIIPVDSLPAGIVHLTLFDPAGNAAAERLCFAGTKPAEPATPAVQFAKITPAERGLNEWSIEVDTFHTDSYSVEVLNAAVPVPDESRSIFTTLWLGDLTTPPCKGDWYFNTGNPEAFKALDALLVSEKWEQFRWSDLLQNKPFKPVYLPDNFLSYEGTATRNKKLLVNQEVNMLFQLKDLSKVFTNVTTDSLGKFRMKNLIFRDTVKVYFQVNSKKSSATNIDIDFRRIENFRPLEAPLPVSFYTSVKRSATDTIPQRVKEYGTALRNKNAVDERFKTLETVVVTAKQKNATEDLNKKLSTGMFHDINEVVFDFVNNEQDAMGFGSILDWLQGRVAGLTIETRNGERIPVIRGSVAKIYQDEMEIPASLINSFPVSEIAMVKVLKSGFAVGGPAVAIYSLRAGLTSKSAKAPVLPSNTLVGYPTADKITADTYPGDISDKTKQDTRSVLYWNTAVKPVHGKETIQFYNNDISKKLRMIIIGFRRDGTPVYLNKEISLR